MGITAIVFVLFRVFTSVNRMKRFLSDTLVLSFPFIQVVFLATVKLIMNAWICFGFVYQTGGDTEIGTFCPARIDSVVMACPAGTGVEIQKKHVKQVLKWGHRLCHSIFIREEFCGC